MSTCPSGHESSADDYCDVCGLPIPAGGAAAPAADASSAPSTPAGQPPAAPAPAAAEPDGPAACPNCQATNPPNALFCEACGYDFTTGSLPRPVAPPSIDSILDLPSPAAPAVPPAPAPAGLDDPGTADARPSTPSTPSTPSAPAAPASVAPPLAQAWVAEVWIDPDWYADQESSDPLPSAGVPGVVPLRSTSILVGRTSRSRGIHPDIDLGSDNGISRRHCQLTTDGTRWWVEDLGSSNGTYLGTSTGALPKDPVPVGERREIGSDARVYLGAWTRIVVRRATPGEV